MSLRQWLEHKTNARHVWCRFLDCLFVYDKIWKKIFNGKRPVLSRRELITLTRLRNKKRKLEKERNELKHQRQVGKTGPSPQ